jgi:hypothetical protein
MVHKEMRIADPVEITHVRQRSSGAAWKDVPDEVAKGVH